MTNKQKRTAINPYQFSVYHPINKKVIRSINDGNTITYELSGVRYPYRDKEFNVEWLEAFEKR